MYGNQPFGDIELGSPSPTPSVSANVLPGYIGLCLFGQPVWKSSNSSEKHSSKSIHCYSRIQNLPPHTNTVRFNGYAAIRRR